MPVPLDSVAAARGTQWTGTLTADRRAADCRPTGRASSATSSRARSGSCSRDPAGRRAGGDGSGTTRPSTTWSPMRSPAPRRRRWRTRPPTATPTAEKGIALESEGTYTRSGTRQQGEQELQMTASGQAQGEPPDRDGRRPVSAKGSEAGEMTISVPAVGQTVPGQAVEHLQHHGRVARRPLAVRDAAARHRLASSFLPRLFLGLAARGLAAAALVPHALAVRDRVHATGGADAGRAPARARGPAPRIPARFRSTPSVRRSSRRCSPRRTRGSGSTAASTGSRCGRRWAIGAGGFDWSRRRDRAELRRAVSGASERRAGDAGRQHDHPAARQESLSLPLAESAAQAQGGGHRLPAGARARQGPDPRALSQRGGAGSRGVGRGGGEPAVLPDRRPTGSR